MLYEMFKNEKDQLIAKEIMTSVAELQYAGFEPDTFFVKSAEFHNDAYTTVIDDASYNLVERVLDSANLSLPRTAEGHLAYEMLERNLRTDMENRVGEIIEKMYFDN